MGILPLPTLARDSESSLVHRSCPSVTKMQKMWFSQKLSNLELWCLLTTIESRTWAFQRTHHGTPKMQDGGTEWVQSCYKRSQHVTVYSSYKQFCRFYWQIPVLANSTVVTCRLTAKFRYLQNPRHTLPSISITCKFNLCYIYCFSSKPIPFCTPLVSGQAVQDCCGFVNMAWRWCVPDRWQEENLK